MRLSSFHAYSETGLQTYKVTMPHAEYLEMIYFLHSQEDVDAISNVTMFQRRYLSYARFADN